MSSSHHIYEIRPRKDRGVDLISDALPFGRLWYAGEGAINNAIGYANFRSRSHDAVIRVFDEAGNVTETHEHAGGLQGLVSLVATPSRSRSSSFQACTARRLALQVA